MPFVAGLVNVRGQLVTVVEGWRALGQNAAGTDAAGGGGTTILMTAGEKVVGVTVDEVVDLLAVSPSSLEPREALTGVDPVLVRAVGRRGDQAFVVLDTDALLAPVLTS
jgi:chemotaxis signal transduction protein